MLDNRRSEPSNTNSSITVFQCDQPGTRQLERLAGKLFRIGGEGTGRLKQAQRQSAERAGPQIQMCFVLSCRAFDMDHIVGGIRLNGRDSVDCSSLGHRAPPSQLTIHRCSHHSKHDRSAPSLGERLAAGSPPPAIIQFRFRERLAATTSRADNVSSPEGSGVMPVRHWKLAGFVMAYIALSGPPVLAEAGPYETVLRHQMLRKVRNPTLEEHP